MTKYYIDQQICEETGEDYYILEEQTYTEDTATKKVLDTFGSWEEAHEAKTKLESE